MVFEKKNFGLLEEVVIKNFPENDPLNNARGWILGKSFENIIDCYIVELEKPLPTAIAIVVTESCLERIN